MSKLSFTLEFYNQETVVSSQDAIKIFAAMAERLTIDPRRRHGVVRQGLSGEFRLTDDDVIGEWDLVLSPEPAPEPPPGLRQDLSGRIEEIDDMSVRSRGRLLAWLGKDATLADVAARVEQLPKVKGLGEKSIREIKEFIYC